MKGKGCPWITVELKSMMNNRDQLLRKARKNNIGADWTLYRRMRNRCTNNIRKAKADFHRNLLQENASEPKKFWSVIKKLFPSRPTNSENSNPTVVDRKTRVARFSEYYRDAIALLKNAALPLRNFTWGFKLKPIRTASKFKVNPIPVKFVMNELKNLKRKKATGLDGLPSDILKDCAFHIAEPLCFILNLSITTSTVPSLWKKAKVIPVFKTGNADLPQNYRPISILPVLSKILEKSVHHQFMTYLENNRLLTEFQFGFRKNRSTKMAATLLCDNIRKEMNNGKMVGAVFLDLSKAFDTIGHGVLLEKLYSYGVRGSELEWFKDYLFDRTQIVEIENTQSRETKIHCGVPQGSILGPLLFIVFFNDLIDHININIIKYADDTVLYYAAKNVDKIESVLNKEMKNVGEYCDVNELLLNLKRGKTESMLFGTKKRLKSHGRDLIVSFNDSKINFVNSYVYLGNLIDSSLNLTENFDLCYKRASGRLRLLKRIRSHLTTEAATAVYHSMLVPSKHKDVLKSSFLVSNWSGRLFTRKRRLKDVFLGTSFNLSQQDVLKPSYTCLKKNQFKLVSARRLEVVSISCF